MFYCCCSITHEGVDLQHLFLYYAATQRWEPLEAFPPILCVLQVKGYYIYMRIKISDESKRTHPLYTILKSGPDIASPLKEGDSVEVTLLSAQEDKAFFDIKDRGTAIVYGIEFMNAKEMIKKMSPQDTCTVTVVETENEDGYIEVSLIRALHQQNWEEIKLLKESGDVVDVKVKAANSGGLLASLQGIKAFIPVSQLSADHYPHVPDADKRKIFEALQEFVGQDLKVRILDFNSKAEKLILSEKEVTDEGVRQALSGYAVGDKVKIVVSGVADFGVFVRFVDNPHIEGLVHISEIDHKLIESPKEAVAVDDEMDAQIIEIKDGRVSLSFKALKPNPWDDAAKYFAEGQEVEGTVSKFNPFGALVLLDHDVQGLIHISEFEDADVMRSTLQEGKTYTFVITQCKPEEKRIILKLKS